MYIIVAICFWLALTDAVSIFLSYACDKESFRSMAAMFAIGAVQSANWCLILKISESEKDLFAMSLCWEVLQSIVFLAVPIIFFGVRLNTVNGAGVALLLAGMLCCRLGSH